MNVDDSKVQEVMKEIHEALLRKSRKNYKDNDDFIIENRIFALICRDFKISPFILASKMNEEYGYALTSNDVLHILKKRKFNTPVERKEVFVWAKRVTDEFIRAIEGNKEAFEHFEKKRKEPALKNGTYHGDQDRIAAIMIYVRYPKLDTNGDFEQLQKFGNILAKYFFYDISDAISIVYGFGTSRQEKRKLGDKLTYEQALTKVEQLESILDRTNTMLSDLQDEFDQQLEESKVKEFSEFFSKLNSDKYGCILDELLVANKGANQLKKSGYQLPIEINGLLIMVKKLIQFVRDNHIEPIMKVGDIREVSASDIEFCIYEGSPFLQEGEKKTIKVISPGWIYKDKEIQISRPKVKEEA